MNNLLTASKAEVEDIAEQFEEAIDNNLVAPRPTEIPGQNVMQEAQGGTNLTDTFWSNHLGKQVQKYDIDKVYQGTPVDLDLMLYYLERSSKTKKKCVDLLVYLPFVIFVILWLVFSTMIDDSYYMNSSLKDMLRDEEVPDIHVLKTYKDIMKFDDLWPWIEGPLINQLWNEEWFEGRPKTTKEKFYVQTYNRLFGALRIRQNRVSNDSCVIAPSILKQIAGNPNFDQGCFDEYSDDKKDVKDYPQYPVDPLVNEAFQYRSCDQIGGGISYGGRRLSYECGGYSINIPFRTDKAQVEQIFKLLKENNWTDKQTRSFFVEFYTYNPNLNYFVNVRMVVEFFEGGSVLPTWNFRVFKLETFRTRGDYVHFAFSLLLPVYVLWYIYLWFRDMYRAHLSKGWYYHLFDIWNLIDIANFGFFLASFTLRTMWYVHDQRQNFRIITNDFPKLDVVAQLYVLDLQVTGINTILTCFKVFKYFSLDDKLNVLIRTITKAIPGLIGAGIMLAFCVGGFVCAGFLLFGWDLDEFKDPSSSISTLLRLLIGDFDYESMKEENRQLFPWYFIAYVAIGFFLIFQLFLAVINEAFGEVNENTLESLPFLNDPKAITDNLWFTAKYLGHLATKIATNTRKQVGKVRTDEKKTVIVEDSSVQFNHGDDALVNRLKDFQELKNGQSLTIDDLKTALGPEASKTLIDRIMKRFDTDNSNTIEINELQDEDGNLRKLIRTPEELKAEMEQQNKEALEREQQRKAEREKERELKKMISIMELQLLSMQSFLEKLEVEDQQ